MASSPVLRRFADKTTVIPIGIADDASRPAIEDFERWRGRVPERFFLFVGALRYYKGLPFLIEAARRSELPVVIVGAGEMDAEIRRAELKNVTLLGEVAEVDKNVLFSLCTCFVFPSHLRSEAFGVSLAEAARAGRPMISCEIGTGTSYVNINDVTGLIVPPADAVALAEAMRRVWMDAKMAAAMGERARARYEDLFTGAAMSAAYCGVYDELVSRETPAR